MVRLVSRLSARFHRNLASPEWLQSLSSYVEKAIAAHPEYQTSEAIGAVFSEYNEARYMGPQSAVKFHFIVEVGVVRRDSDTEHDSYQVWVRYLPATQTFKTRRELVDTRETRQKNSEKAEERRAAVEAATSPLRANFENQEAIYIEKGALRVRVTNIQAHLDRITAEIEEIPTIGLEDTMPHLLFLDRPLRWEIGAGYLTIASDHNWSMGYGGWKLYFAPQLVQGVVELAARWSDDVDWYERYNQVLRFVGEHNPYETGRRLFPDTQGEADEPQFLGGS